MEELLDIESDILEKAYNNYYKMEVLRGYCENYAGGNISSSMLETLLEEICMNQKFLIKDIDTKFTHFVYKNFSALTQNTD